MVEIPAPLRDAVDRAATEHLTRELRARGLLLVGHRRAAAGAQAADDGRRLLPAVIHACYPLSQYDTQRLAVEFDDAVAAARVGSALAFGAATARVLRPPHEVDDEDDPVALLSATFHLGIGLVDGLCDEEPATGLRLLDLIAAGDVAAAARHPRPRGWLQVALPPELESDASAAFAAAVVEAFFATLHATFPGDGWAPLRATVGDQLAAALQAERASVLGPSGQDTPAQLAAHSYATSVLPFQIVGTLTGLDRLAGTATALGEAMWRIDDLVDLCADTSTGALNGLLLATGASGIEALERLLDADAELLARAASHAGASLATALAPHRSVGGHDAPGAPAVDVVLWFVERYAGITPAEPL